MNNIYIALDNVRSLYNIGSIFRICGFFGVKNVILLGISGTITTPGGNVLLNPKVKKTSLGAETYVNLTFLNTAQHLIDFAKTNNLQIISVEQHANSVNLKEVPAINNCILVFGNEVTGVNAEILNASSKILEIKQLGPKNSLNVFSTVGIVLYHLS